MDKLIIPASAQIDVYSHVGPFDQGVAALKEAGVDLWSARDLAETRIRAGAQHPVNTEWSWVSPAFLHDNGRDADILVVSGSHSPLLKHPEAATTAHRANSEFTDFDYNSLRERAAAVPAQALQSGVLLLPRKDVRDEISSTSLADYSLTAFLFEDQALPYGAFLSELKIENVPLYVVDKDYSRKQPNPFARALWVSSLDHWSSLGGSDRDLRSGGGRGRGVRFVERPAKQAAPDSPLETQVAIAPGTHDVLLGDQSAIVDGKRYVAAEALEALLANIRRN